MGRRWRTVLLLLAAAIILGLFAARRLRGPAGAEDESPIATDVAVHVGAIRRATLHRYVTAYGRVVPQPPAGGAPPARVTVGSSGSGLLVGIDCAEGDRVRAGQVLFRLDSRVAEVEVERAGQALAFAETMYARQEKLMDVDGTSQKALLQAERARDAARADLSAAETRLALLRIASPVSGTVVRIDARLGQAVEPNTSLAEVIDLGRLAVEADVPSREAALLRVGQTVLFESGRGAVSFVGSDIDTSTDTLPVRASIPVDGGPAGRFVELRVVVEVRTDRLAVPREAVVTLAGVGTWICRVDGDRAVRVPVTAGLAEGDLVEVAGEGLQEGMLVVTDEAYSLPGETKIRIQAS